jgi:hypothetical protein
MSLRSVETGLRAAARGKQCIAFTLTASIMKCRILGTARQSLGASKKNRLLNKSRSTRSHGACAEHKRLLRLLISVDTLAGP